VALYGTVVAEGMLHKRQGCQQLFLSGVLRVACFDAVTWNRINKEDKVRFRYRPYRQVSNEFQTFNECQLNYLGSDRAKAIVHYINLQSNGLATYNNKSIIHNAPH